MSIASTLSSAFARQKPHLILWLPVFFALGVSFYYLIRFEPPFLLSITVFAIAFSALLILWPWRESDKAPCTTLFYLLLCLLLVTGGFLAAQIRTINVHAPILQKKTGPLTIEGQIVDINLGEDGKSQRLVLYNPVIEGFDPKDTPHKVRLNVKYSNEYRPGDHVRVLAGLNPPSPPVAPYAFDFQRYAYFQGIGAFGFTYAPPELIDKNNKNQLALILESARQAIQNRVTNRFSGGSSAVLTALMTGERGAISDADWEAMRVSGLAHMLAISGLHVGIVAAVIFFFVRLILAAIPKLALNMNIKKMAAIAAMLGAFLYMLLVGSSVPTVRAMIMTGIVLTAILLDRQPFSLRLVAIAAFAILLFRPDAIFGASFQMSFAAVTMLIFVYEKISKPWGAFYRSAGMFRKIALYFLGVCMTTVIASLATGPFSVFHFQQFANHSLVSNFLAVPILGFMVMPFVVLSYVFMPVGLDYFPLWIAEQGVSWILWIAHETHNLPFADWNPPAILPSWPFYLFILSALFMVLWQGKGRWLGAVPAAAMLLVIILTPRPSIYVASSGKLIGIALPHENAMRLSNFRSERFTAENWQRMAGLKYGAREKIDKWDAAQCDEYGCHFEMNRHKVALSYHSASHAQDCKWADIVISKEPMESSLCHNRPHIGYFDLWREGAHSVTLGEGQTIQIKSVLDARGMRPWTVTNRR